VLRRVSVANRQVQAQDGRYDPVVSANGRVIAFESDAINLVPGDTNDVRDIFARILDTALTVRVSVGAGGAQANGESRNASVDALGRFIAFESDATNLVPGDDNDVTDIFLVDLLLNTIERVSLGNDGGQSDGVSRQPCVSGNGRFVAFSSEASNLVEGDLNGRADIFVRDLLLDKTVRVNLSGDGAEAALGDSYRPSLSSSGRYVAFHSDATNLVLDDTNGVSDIFVHDRDVDENSVFDEGNGPTVRVSVHTDGTAGTLDSANASISGNGSRIAFESRAPNLVDGDQNGESDVFIHDRTSGETTRVSVATGGAEADFASFSASLSRDGLVVGFESLASNLALGVPFGQRAVYLHTIDVAVTQHIGVNENGEASNSDTLTVRLSSDGRYAVFASAASNLVGSDTNNQRDIFLRDRIELTFNGTGRPGDLSNFEVENAIGDTGNILLVLVSCTGNAGFPLPNGRIVPLTFDHCTTFGLEVSTLLSGIVDGSGHAATTVVPFPPLAAGQTLRACAVTIGTGGFRSITAPIAIPVIN
ncbi:MAG: hypothetical protein RL885_02440, partial [Planctomycetota bacterium]